MANAKANINFITKGVQAHKMMNMLGTTLTI